MLQGGLLNIFNKLPKCVQVSTKNILNIYFLLLPLKTGLGAYHTQPASNFQKYPFWPDVYFFISLFLHFIFTQYFQYI